MNRSPRTHRARRGSRNDARPSPIDQSKRPSGRSRCRHAGMPRRGRLQPVRNPRSSGATRPRHGGRPSGPRHRHRGIAGLPSPPRRSPSDPPRVVGLAGQARVVMPVRPWNAPHSGRVFAPGSLRINRPKAVSRGGSAFGSMSPPTAASPGSPPSRAIAADWPMRLYASCGAPRRPRPSRRRWARVGFRSM